MNALEGRLVIVPADGLGDLLELAATASSRVKDTDPALADALTGAAARVRTELLREPQARLPMGGCNCSRVDRRRT